LCILAEAVAGVCAQEIEFVDRLRAKEAARMEELERLYVHKERERKALFTQAQEDVARLEAKLRKSLAEVRGPGGARRSGVLGG
jgi:predicted HAD superfamily phosphohydrolase